MEVETSAIVFETVVKRYNYRSFSLAWRRRKESRQLTNSVTPVCKDSGSWECPIDKENIARNTIEGCCCVDQFEVILWEVNVCCERGQSCDYLSGDSSIRDSGVVIGGEVVVSPASSVRCRIGTSLAKVRFMRGSGDTRNYQTQDGPRQRK
jgi:hypothetical protein